MYEEEYDPFPFPPFRSYPFGPSTYHPEHFTLQTKPNLIILTHVEVSCTTRVIPCEVNLLEFLTLLPVVHISYQLKPH